MTTGGGAGGSGSAGILYIDVQGRFDDFERRLNQLQQQAGQQGQTLGQRFSGGIGTGLKIAAGAAIGLGAAVLGAVPAMQSLAAEAARADSTNKMFAKSLERFKVPAGEAEKAVSDLSTKLGVAPEVIKEGMTTILRAGGTLEDAVRTITAAGASAAAAGSDIGNAVENASVAIATGRSELLETAGIITNASDAYKDYAKSIGVKTEALTEAQKIEAFSKAIYKESKYEIADLSTIMGGYAGVQARNAQVSREFKQALGEALLPAMTKLTEVGTDLLGRGTEWIKSFQQNEGVKQFGSGLMTVASQVMPLFQSAVAAIAPVVRQVLTTFAQVGVQVAPYVQQVITIIRQLAVSAQGTFTQIAPYAQQMIASLRPLLVALGPLFANAFRFVQVAWETVLKPAIIAIMPVVSAVFRAAVQVITTAVNVISGIFKFLSQLFTGDFRGAAETLRGIWFSLARGILQAARTIYDGVVQWLGNIGPKAIEFGRHLIDGLLNGIRGGIDRVRKGVAELGSNMISSLKSALGIRSPSREMWILGEHAADGLVLGIQSRTPAVGKAAYIMGEHAANQARAGLAANQEPTGRAAYILGEHAAMRVADAVTKNSPRAVASVKSLGKSVVDETKQAIANLEKEIAFDKFASSLTAQSVARLKQLMAEARAVGDSQKYNAVKSEMERREDAHTAAVRANADAVRQHAEELKRNRQELERSIQNDAWRKSLQGFTAAQLESAKASARAAGDQARYNDILTEQQRRVQAANDQWQKYLDLQVQIGQNTQDSLTRVGGKPGTQQGPAFKGRKLGLADFQADIDALDSTAKIEAFRQVIVRLATDGALAKGALTDITDALAVQQGQIDAAASLTNTFTDSWARARVTQEGVTATYDDLMESFRQSKKTGEDFITSVLKPMLRDGQVTAAVYAELVTTLNALGNAGQVGRAELPKGAGRDARPAPAEPAGERSGGGHDRANQAAAFFQQVQKAAESAAFDKYREGLRRLSDEQLETARSAAFAARNFEEYNAILAEQGRRTNDAAATVERWNENLEKLAFDKWKEELRDYTAAQLDDALATAVATKNVEEYNAVLAELKRRQDAMKDAALNLTVKVFGIDTGIKQLDLFKQVLQGVQDVISDTFQALVSGTGNAADGVLKNMARMALGIVRQVAIAIAAYQAQAIAAALLQTATPFSWGLAIAAFAAAAAIAGIAAGLEARLNSGGGGGGGGSYSPPVSGGAAERAGVDAGLVDIPNSSVTVIAAPSWIAEMGKHVDRLGGYFDRLITEGIRVQGFTDGSSPRSGMFDLLTP